MTLFELIVAARTYIEEECGDYIFASKPLPAPTKPKLTATNVLAKEPGPLVSAPIEKSKEENQSCPILLLTTPLPDEQTEMVQKLTQALCDHVAPAQLINVTTVKEWRHTLNSSQIRLIIVSESTLLKTPALFTHYTSTPPRLGGVATYVMADPAVYLQQPSLKRGLWHALQEQYRNL